MTKSLATRLRERASETINMATRDICTEAADALEAKPSGAVPLPEPVAWGIFDSQGFYEAGLDKESAERFCAKYNRSAADPLKPFTFGPLYAAPVADDVARDAGVKAVGSVFLDLRGHPTARLSSCSDAAGEDLKEGELLYIIQKLAATDAKAGE